ncbi:efflux RND transporter periplasmic adaptor subunit [Pseudooceanicola sp. MF1-13]|uniref:efflux RND transporter periplasmic adaptor subunit n=1 Tax=Pseudooceanicola sp. MF1-13 TaxID=3379095 RepID=UPI003891A97A
MTEKTHSSRADQVVELDSALWRRLLTEDEDDEVFFDSWLALQARQLPGAVNAVLVVLAEDGRLRPVAFWPKGAPPGAEAIKAAQSALKKASGVVRRAQEADGRTNAFAYPVKSGDEVVAVGAFTVQNASEADLQAALRRVQWGSSWLEGRFAHQERETVKDTAGRLATVLDLVGVSLEHDSAGAAALAFTTEAATRLGATRVSLGQRKRYRSKVLSVSHSAQISRRQNLVRGIGNAMDEAIDQRRIVVFPAADDDNAVTACHRELSQKLGASGPVVSVPLHDNKRIIGAVTAEFPPDKVVSDADIDALEATSAVSAQILDLRRREERWLITKSGEVVWAHLGRLLGRGYLGRKLAVLTLIALTIFFATYHSDFDVPAQASLEGEVQRVVAAPFDGYIATEAARPGDLVQQGDVLAALDDRELQLELSAWRNRRVQHEAERQRALADRDIAQAKIFEAQSEEADVQIALVERQIELATLRAPFDGVILSGDLSQGLGRGVRLGDPLFQIAPLDRYRVILLISEEDISHIAVGQTGEVLVSAFPDRPFPVEVTKITAVTLPEEGKNAFRVEATLTGETPELRPGMEGAARIGSGEHLLIWIWTRRATNWARVQLWKWLP